MASPGEIGTKAELGNDGALLIVVAIDAHGVGVHRPIVGDPGKRWNFPRHQLLGVLLARLRAPS